MQIPPLSKSLHQIEDFTAVVFERRNYQNDVISTASHDIVFWGGLSNAGSGGSVANPDKIGGASSAKPENARGMAITTKLDC